MPELDGWPEGAKKTVANLRRNIQGHKKLDEVAKSQLLAQLADVGGRPFDATELDNFSKSVATLDSENYCCGFCGKSQYEVSRIIAGPGICVCDECVDLMASILAEEGHKATERLRVDISPVSEPPATQILGVLALYIRAKFPGEEVTVSVHQDASTIKMTVQSSSGRSEVLEEALDKLG